MRTDMSKGNRSSTRILEMIKAFQEYVSERLSQTSYRARCWGELTSGKPTKRTDLNFRGAEPRRGQQTCGSLPSLHAFGQMWWDDKGRLITSSIHSAGWRLEGNRCGQSNQSRFSNSSQSLQRRWCAMKAVKVPGLTHLSKWSKNSAILLPNLDIKADIVPLKDSNLLFDHGKVTGVSLLYCNVKINTSLKIFI
ncbi:hypothetical protein EMPG_14542 [Blastomyces silverae]|uniref:Uncharacterized protein n=1 Tax=Blastomyces silverae TaxID=2060906 RepID=A0A0H1BG92_9EURO|nr:hypothetical protein EMPG_14542 [Blastomyces silverae]